MKKDTSSLLTKAIGKTIGMLLVTPLQAYLLLLSLEGLGVDVRITWVSTLWMGLLLLILERVLIPSKE